MNEENELSSNLPITIYKKSVITSLNVFGIIFIIYLTILTKFSIILSRCEKSWNYYLMKGHNSMKIGLKGDSIIVLYSYTYSNKGSTGS